MKPRHFLARIAAFVTAAVAIGMFLGPARADAADHQPDEVDGWGKRDLDIGTFGSADAADPDSDVSANRDSTSAMAPDGGSLLEGWGNQDLDIGASTRSMADELGSRLDGYDTPEMDLNPSELWEAMAFGIGSILDGWGNRDMDIGAF